MSNGWVELHARQNEDGTYSVLDQHGRKVRGVRGLSIHTCHDDVTVLAVEVVERRGGLPVLALSVPKPPPPADTGGCER